MSLINKMLFVVLSASLISCASSNNDSMDRNTAGFLKRIFNSVKSPNVSYKGSTETTVSFDISSGGISGINSYRIFRNGVMHETVPKVGSLTSYTDRNLVPGSKYTYHVRTNAKGDDGKRSHRINAETRWSPRGDSNIKNYVAGFGIQYNRGRVNRAGKMEIHPQDAMAIMYIGGDEVICQIRGGSDGDLYEVQYKSDKIYYELIARRARSMQKIHGWSKDKEGRSGIKGCRELIENGAQFADNAPEEKFTVAVVKYTSNPLGACRPNPIRAVRKVPIGYYHMVRKHSNSYHLDSELKRCR